MSRTFWRTASRTGPMAATAETCFETVPVRISEETSVLSRKTLVVGSEEGEVEKTVFKPMWEDCARLEICEAWEGLEGSIPFESAARVTQR